MTMTNEEEVTINDFWRKAITGLWLCLVLWSACSKKVRYIMTFNGPGKRLTQERAEASIWKWLANLARNWIWWLSTPVRILTANIKNTPSQKPLANLVSNSQPTENVRCSLFRSTNFCMYPSITNKLPLRREWYILGIKYFLSLFWYENSKFRTHFTKHNGYQCYFSF